MQLITRGAFRLRYIVLGTALLVWPFFFAMPGQAQGNSAIAQGFQTEDGGITAAALVSIERDNPNSIELSSADKASRLTGIVSNNPLIDLSDGGSSVQVVTSGLTFGLVTNLNGNIRNGDKITASPIEGVGMKATESTVVVGTAQGSLDDVETETRTIKDVNGNEKEVRIGLVPIQVSVAYYSVDVGKASFVPGFLQELANSVAGRNVSPIRVLVAALILLLLFVSVTVLLYSAVRSSIISIGRNPLSEGAVRKSLFEVALTVVAVLIFATLTIYLVLTV
jgi:translation elongation factor EF-1beta